MNETKETLQIEDKPYIKLIKNTKGYNWEIKFYDKDIDNILPKIIELNNQMIDRYGASVDV